jgi:hypothetical protein
MHVFCLEKEKRWRQEKNETVRKGRSEMKRDERKR